MATQAPNNAHAVALASAAAFLAPRRMRASLKADLARLIAANGRIPRSQGRVRPGKLSTKTRDERLGGLATAFEHLYALGFHLEFARNLQRRHVDALITAMVAGAPQCGIPAVSPGRVRNMLSFLRTLAGWLDKRELIGDGASHCAAVPASWFAVSSVAVEDKAPALDEVLDVLAAAESRDPHLSMVSRKTFTKRVYDAVAELGVTKRGRGWTMHGLRHRYAQDLYARLAHVPAPIQGSALRPTQSADRAARQELVERLGHHRAAKVGAYIGAVVRGLPRGELHEAAAAPSNVPPLFDGLHPHPTADAGRRGAEPATPAPERGAQ